MFLWMLEIEGWMFSLDVGCYLWVPIVLNLDN